MLPADPVRHHRIKKIIIGIIVVPIVLFLMLIMITFVANVFERSRRLSQGDYSLDSQPTDAAVTNNYDEARRLLVEGVNRPAIGTVNPKVTIVEFADFACPYCLQSWPAMREISLRYADTVKIIFRSWPGHDYSINLAMGAYCAGEQGKFWEMHDKLYQNQATDFGSDKNDLARLALELNIYNEQFQNCFDKQTYSSLIYEDITDSKTLAVPGTPTWFINGEKIEGTLTTKDFEDIIKAYE